jgi:hypothetical protein
MPLRARATGLHKGLLPRVMSPARSRNGGSPAGTHRELLSPPLAVPLPGSV